MLLDLLGARHDLVEVPYGQCDELARVTGGYVYVPVLVDDDGKGVVESRDICDYLLARASGRLVPSYSTRKIFSLCVVRQHDVRRRRCRGGSPRSASGEGAAGAAGPH